jgi:hypothetical protein
LVLVFINSEIKGNVLPDQRMLHQGSNISKLNYPIKMLSKLNRCVYQPLEHFFFVWEDRVNLLSQANREKSSHLSLTGSQLLRALTALLRVLLVRKRLGMLTPPQRTPGAQIGWCREAPCRLHGIMVVGVHLGGPGGP